MTIIKIFIYVWLLCNNIISVDSKYVHLPIKRNSKVEGNNDTSTAQDMVSSTTEKMLDVGIPKESNFYSINLSIGSPFQQVTLLLDTGSSDMVVVSSENSYCSTSMANNCHTFGTFDKYSSTSLQDLNDQFTLKYGDGTFSRGDWVHDNINLNGIDIALTFGLATNTDSIGVLGIGLQGLEVSSTSYNNFPLQLKKNGIISKNSYSIFLEKDKQQGDILFGAIDTSKIDNNNFFTFPMVNRYTSRGYANPIRSEITMQGIGIVTADGEQITISQTKLPALLDSGSTISYMPTKIIEALIDNLSNHGITITNHGENYGIDCQHGSDFNTKIVIDFGGLHIDITLSQLVLESSIAGQCLFGITGQDTDTVILGDTFFTSAYVVFDLDDYEISLSQLNTGGGESQYKDIDNSVPFAKKTDGFYNIWSADEGVELGGNIFTLSAKNAKDVSAATSSESFKTIFSSSTVSSKAKSSSILSKSSIVSTSTSSSSTIKEQTSSKSINDDSKTSSVEHLSSTIITSSSTLSDIETISSNTITHRDTTSSTTMFSSVAKVSSSSSDKFTSTKSTHAINTYTSTIESSSTKEKHSSTTSLQLKSTSKSHSHKTLNTTTSTTHNTKSNGSSNSEISHVKTVSATSSDKDYSSTMKESSMSDTDSNMRKNTISSSIDITCTVIITSSISALPTTLVTDPNANTSTTTAKNAGCIGVGRCHGKWLLPILAIFL